MFSPFLPRGSISKNTRVLEERTEGLEICLFGRNNREPRLADEKEARLDRDRPRKSFSRESMHSNRDLPPQDIVQHLLCVRTPSGQRKEIARRPPGFIAMVLVRPFPFFRTRILSTRFRTLRAESTSSDYSNSNWKDFCDGDFAILSVRGWGFRRALADNPGERGETLSRAQRMACGILPSYFDLYLEILLRA